MNPREFHALAVRLAAGRTPAERRTAIGRSYYSVFNVAADLLRTMGFHVRRGAAAHGEVHKCLHNSSDPEVIHVANELADLHSWRNRADYQLDKIDVEHPANAESAADLAGELIQTLDQSFSGPNRPRLQSAIAAWRRANGYP